MTTIKDKVLAFVQTLEREHPGEMYALAIATATDSQFQGSTGGATVAEAGWLYGRVAAQAQQASLQMAEHIRSQQGAIGGVVFLQAVLAGAHAKGDSARTYIHDKAETPKV